MRGHIRQRTKGSWAIVIDVGRDPETGKRCQQWHTVRGTKRDAEQAMREMLVGLDKGTYVKPNRLTVAEYLQQWLQGYVAINTAPKTRERYEEIVRGHLIPALGSIPLPNLQPRHIQKYYADALESGRRDGKGGLSARTVLKHHRILYEALKHGVRQGVLIRNVAEAVDPPRPRNKEAAVLGPSEARLLVEASRGTPYHPIFFTALYTGLRRGELLGLRWCDVYLDLATLSVVQTLQQLRTGEYIFREPKTKRGRRQIALPPSLAILLREHRATQENVQKSLGKTLAPTDLVFSHPDGKPIRPNSVTRALSSIARLVGLYDIRLHDLRHAHATILLRQGIHPKIVQERLGHSSISITLDTYSHVLPGLQEAAARRFEEGLQEAPIEVSLIGIR
ncbi:MAG TPA: tyrosine-type recombinase/integrase [Dehalococcoidia bacterium]|nr:tyrosine-type recombinase/integrase [Dehalococcoidia bacterium]